MFFVEKLCQKRFIGWKLADLELLGEGSVDRRSGELDAEHLDALMRQDSVDIPLEFLNAMDLLALLWSCVPLATIIEAAIRLEQAVSVQEER